MEKKLRNIPLAKSGDREISNFIGQELLYDYLAEKLDPARRAAVEEHVKYSREAQSDLEKMNLGLNYLEQLSRTGVSQSVIEEISEPLTYVSELFRRSRFDKWPVGVRWGLEALGVIALIVTILVAVPWDKLTRMLPGKANEEFVLAEISRNGHGDTNQTNDEVAQFQDEGIKSLPNIKTSPAAVEVKEVSVAVKATDKNILKTGNLNDGTSLPAGIPAAEFGGFLFRGDLVISNLSASVPKLISRIEGLGGRKAGDVDLGWSKAPSSSYFHFTIPAAKYSELMNFMASFGKLKISKGKHPRVMPDGILRIIVTAEEAKK